MKSKKIVSHCKDGLKRQLLLMHYELVSLLGNCISWDTLFLLYNPFVSSDIEAGNLCFCLACEAEARHMYYFSGGGVSSGRVNFLC